MSIFVMACTFVVCLIGVAAIFMTMIMGGSQQVQTAVDAASLSVALNGAYGLPSGNTAPSVPFNTTTSATSDQTALLQQYLKQPPSGSVGSMGPTDTNGLSPVDLATFNRLIGVALVVQMNASADGNQSGLTNAASLIQAIEGSNKSYGSQLTANLSSNTWAQANYNGVSNAATLIGQSQAPKFNPNNYQVAWNYQNQNMPCNVDMSAYNTTTDPNRNYLLPITNFNTMSRLCLPASMFCNYSAGGQPSAALPGSGSSQSPSYLAGYTAIQIGSGPVYCGVPNGPTKQPHLESKVTFSKGAKSPLQGVPPNAFMVGGTSAVSQTNNISNLETTAVSTVGVQGTVFNPGLVNGYLIINNGAPSTGATANSNLTAAEMTQVVVAALYNTREEPIGTSTYPNCFNLPGNFTDGTAPVNCTGSRLYQAGLPNYANEYPCTGNFGNPQNSSFLNGQAALPSSNTVGYTGKFTTNVSTSSNAGQVTVEAGVYDYIKQYFPAETEKTIKFMIQRLLEIKPGLASGLTVTVFGSPLKISTNCDEINQVLGMGKYSYLDNPGNPPAPGSFPVVQLGMKSYLYLNSNNILTLDTIGPEQIAKNQLSSNAYIPDGTRIVNAQIQSRPGSNTYDIFLGVTRAFGSENSRGQLFRTWGSDNKGIDLQGGTVATDTLTVTASSGATGGMLGLVNFAEYTTVDGTNTLNLNLRGQ